MQMFIEGKNGDVAGRFAIVVSRYNEHITGKLLTGAVETLRAAELTRRPLMWPGFREPGKFRSWRSG